MVRNGRLLKISFILSVQYIVLDFIIFLSVLHALVADALHDSVPIFEPRKDNISVYVGETATLHCAVRGLQTRYLIWRRMSEPNPLTIGEFRYAQDDRISLRRVEDKHEWNLIIKDVQFRDAGVYECAVSSREKYRTHVILKVIEKSHNTLENEYSNTKDDESLQHSVVLSGKTFVSKGQNIFLTCNATGEDYAPDEVDWFINGHKVNQRLTPRVRIFNDNDRRTLYSTLEIRRSTMSDKGMYVCRGPNSETSSITIHILDEEKSNHMKRGDDTSKDGLSGNSATSSWNKHCLLQMACTVMLWIIHLWHIS